MKGYFYGYYYKIQSETQTIAMIAATHGDGKNRTCSLQVITESGAWAAEFPKEAYFQKGSLIKIGKNRFSRKGVSVDVNTEELSIQGKLAFGPITPLKYDVMGPFAMIPFMECRHMVGSVRHLVNGRLTVNGEEFVFENAQGYWEGDTGRSFPKEYLWTQTFLPQDGSLMLSVADIPFPGFRFTGIIGFVYWKGQEYRLATYLGAKAAEIRDGGAIIVQGDKKLKVRLIEASGKALRAPVAGSMVRTIRESATCKAAYEFWIGDEQVFQFVTDQATFEYEYQA
ncbi:MAG: hypothetical protein IK081_14705 [Lachnospiraceae bacterium]|nr:hypothetical protein [Lachnospiraceae bacterium]